MFANFCYDRKTKKTNMERVVTVILVVLFIIILVVTILIVVLGDKKNQQQQLNRIQMPSKVDAVLVDKGRERVSYQVVNLQKCMPWLHRIVVINMTKNFIRVAGSSESSVLVTYVDTDPKEILHILENIATLVPRISNNFLFLGDSCAPTTTVKPQDLWSTSGKIRVFNYFNIDAKIVGFDKYYEKTMPVFLIDLQKLLEAGTLDNLLFSLSLAEQILYSPSINRSVIFTGNQFADDAQLIRKNHSSELFLTFLISPHLPDKTKANLNKNLLKFLQTQIKL